MQVLQQDARNIYVKLERIEINLHAANRVSKFIWVKILGCLAKIFFARLLKKFSIKYCELTKSFRLAFIDARYCH